MAVRESKQALADATALLRTDTQAARVYLREVQRRAGPLPYATIVAAMRAAGTTDAQVVATIAADLASPSPDPITGH